MKLVNLIAPFMIIVQSMDFLNNTINVVSATLNII